MKKVIFKSTQKQFCVILSMVLCLVSINVMSQDSTKAKEAFKPSGKLWGYAFGDYAYKFHADSALRGKQQYSGLPNNYNSFNLRRVYLGYDYKFSPNISSQLLLAHESGFEANPGSTNTLADGNRSVYVKAMNIRFANVIPRATIVAGQQATPTFATLTEGIWGYRSIEKTIGDMRGISSSTDLGLGVFGKIGKNENVGYDFLVANNNGAKLENNKYKKIYTSLYFYLLNKKIVIQGNFEHDNAGSAPAKQNINNLKAFAAYTTSQTTFAVEAFTQLKSNGAAYVSGTDVNYADVASSGISFYVTQTITPDKLRFFARYDIFNPDTKYDSQKTYATGYDPTKESFATLGLDIIPFKNIHIMPNLWYNHYASKIPGATGNLKGDYDLEGRVTLYFSFNK
ncbi:MAG: hypothetical protein ACTHNG_03515 [Ginsengibacter sp.]